MTASVRYAAVRLCLDVQFWFPIWLVFLLHQGFSLAEAALADGLFRLVVVLLEIPLGALGDRLGRRRTLLVTVALTALVFTSIGFVTSVGVLLCVWGLWGILWALASGLDTAYAWELAQQAGLSSATYLGRVRAVTGLAGFVSLLTAGWLYEMAPASPFWVTAGLAVIALPIAWTLPDIAAVPAPENHAVGVGVFIAPQVRWRIVLGALVLLAGWTVQIAFQPLAIELAISPATTGLMYAWFAVARGVGGWLGSRLIAVNRPWVPVGISVMGLGCAGVWAAVTFGQPAVAMWVLLPCVGVAHAATTTVTDIWVSEKVPARARATALSVVSALAGAAMVGARPALAVAADRVGAAAAFAGWGLVCLVLASLSIGPWRWVARRGPRRAVSGCG